MTHPNMERKVLLSAEVASLPAYLPRYQDQRGRERLLFRGYVFIEAPVEREGVLFRLRGGLAPIVFDGMVARCPKAVVEQMRARESKSGYIIFESRFEYNQAVLVVDGPYKNQVVLYRGMDKQGRELALFSLLGREVVGSFDRHELEPLKVVN